MAEHVYPAERHLEVRKCDHQQSQCGLNHTRNHIGCAKGHRRPMIQQCSFAGLSWQYPDSETSLHILQDLSLTDKRGPYSHHGSTMR